MSEPQNKTIALILLLAAIASIAGFWVLQGKTQFTGLVANPTGTVTAFVAATTDIALQQSTVNFGNVGVGKTFTSGTSFGACGEPLGNYSNASRFLIRNDGSVFVNITISATALFNSTSGNNSNYRFNSGCLPNNATAAACPNGNLCGDYTLPWYDMPLSSSTYVVCGVNHTDNYDYAIVGIQITVPQGEAAGTRTSTVTFTASQA